MKKISCVIICSIVFFLLGACGKKQPFTVTFDSSGGTNIESQLVESGQCVKEPSNPIKEGFTFVEWQFNGKAYKFDTPVEMDILLTAYYEIKQGTKTVTVTFDYQNGEETRKIQVIQGGQITEPPTPQKQDYVFLSWYDGNDLFDFSSLIDSDITLTAKWKYDKKDTIQNEKPNTSSSKNKENNTDDTTTEAEKCKHLNAFLVPNDSKEHSVPTCTKDGYYLKYCPDCYKQWHEKAKALGHKIQETPYDNGYVEATCCKEGQKGAKEYCYVCKTVIKKGDSIPPNPYNHIGKTYTINKKDATWTQNGYSGDTCCDGCKNNILPENRGTTVSAHCNHSYTKSYDSQKDKIMYKCSDGYIEYRSPDPISISSIEVVRTLSTPGDGVKMVGLTITGGSLDYTVDYEVISEYQYVINRFYIERAAASSIWDYHIMLKDGYYIPDGTQLRIKITDSSGRTFNKTYTVRRYSWNDYDVI